MRAYSASDEEALRARELLKDWAGEGLISEAQYQRMEQETVCELRRTNIFLRAALFLFTLVIVGAAAALFFVLLGDTGRQSNGVFLLIFAAASYVSAELAVSEARLYRYGIEEALAACSAGFLCAGIFFLSDHPYAPAADGRGFPVPVAGAMVSLWIWHRFGLPYASLAAMIFAAWLPDFWTSSLAAQRAITAAFYAAGTVAVAAVRPRHRLTYLDREYSISEALLWLGIYLAINLQLSPGNLFGPWWGGPATTPAVSRPFYWTTWALTWCLPPLVLARGLRQKDRLVIGAGAIAAILTLATNKPYLGWPRHTWDPMLLGVLLAGAAVFVRRWLAGGPGEIRHGFTARRLSGKDKLRMTAGAAAFGLASPHPIAQASSPDFHFGGGDSGGGGASSDY